MHLCVEPINPAKDEKDNTGWNMFGRVMGAPADRNLVDFYVEAMPIRDAVELARFLVETTIGFVKFSVARPKTVGGQLRSQLSPSMKAFTGCSAISSAPADTTAKPGSIRHYPTFFAALHRRIASRAPPRERVSHSGRLTQDEIERIRFAKESFGALLHVHARRRNLSRKKRTISRLASGPRGSV